MDQTVQMWSYHGQHKLYNKNKSETTKKLVYLTERES